MILKAVSSVAPNPVRPPHAGRLRLAALGALTLLVACCANAAQDPPAKESAHNSVDFKDKRIRECSGLAPSLRQPNAVWTHNDSGDSARLFLVDLKTGQTLTVCNLTGVKARDWEDMASFQLEDRPMLVVGDIGSNRGGKRIRKLHFIDEPLLSSATTGQQRNTAVWATIDFQFEDGYPDCEAIAVDAATRAIYLATKSRSGKGGVYRLDLPERAGRSLQTARREAPLHLSMVTAIDIHPDGDRMLMLTYLSISEYRRAKNQTWQDAFVQKPRFVMFPPLGKQVEAACYAREENRIHLAPEGKHASLWTLTVSGSDTPKEDSN